MGYLFLSCLALCSRGLCRCVSSFLLELFAQPFFWIFFLFALILLSFCFSADSGSFSIFRYLLKMFGRNTQGGR